MSTMELIEAIKAKNIERAKQLIQEGADLSQRDAHGWGALNWAAGTGDLAMVQLLLEVGADPCHVGRDQRLPSAIALAAGHAKAVRLIRAAESRDGQHVRRPPERSYCRAYRVKDLRQFPAWHEAQPPKAGNADDAAAGDEARSADDVVFLHQDYTVTRSMWRNEEVIFDDCSAEWKEYCAGVLGFTVPDDLDLIGAVTESDGPAPQQPS